jgi:hypothetical protein
MLVYQGVSNESNPKKGQNSSTSTVQLVTKGARQVQGFDILTCFDDNGPQIPRNCMEMLHHSFMFQQDMLALFQAYSSNKLANFSLEELGNRYEGTSAD